MLKDMIKRSDALAELEKVFYEYNISFGDDKGGFEEAVPKAVKSIPAAYDVDKVIEQLDGEIFLTTNDDGETNSLSISVMEASKVIEIVKGGGINAED